MKELPRNDDLLAVAPHIIWFEPPEKALADPIRFLAYLMTYGTAEEIAVVQRYLDLGDFREALERAPSRHYRRALLGLLEHYDRPRPGPADAAARHAGSVKARHCAKNILFTCDRLPVDSFGCKAVIQTGFSYFPGAH